MFDPFVDSGTVIEAALVSKPICSAGLRWIPNTCHKRGEARCKIRPAKPGARSGAASAAFEDPSGKPN